MRTLVVIAAAASALFATQAAAEQHQDTRAVSFRGVDFNNPQAVDSFYSRLRNSARDVCASNAPFNERARAGDRACVEQIVNEAVDQMRRPLLSARHQRDARPTYASNF